MKLSAYIVTLNEEARLPRTLEALKQVEDEIIIVDSGSIDKTEEIAKSYGCKFMFHKWKNISSQKNFAQGKCKNDYLLRLDADEVLSPELIE
jgi:glycosyltransferase involved in cell wall biosynthesis